MDVNLELPTPKRKSWHPCSRTCKRSGDRSYCKCSLFIKVQVLLTGFLVDVLRQSQMHGFSSLVQDLDNRIALSMHNIEVEKLCGPLPHSMKGNPPPYVTASGEDLF